MTNKLLLISLLFPVLISAQFDQSAVGSLGGITTASDSSLSMTQSIGDVAGTFLQTAFRPNDTDRVNFSQGFVQCFACDDCPIAVATTSSDQEVYLKVFPNPTTGLLQVSGDTESVQRYWITNLQGQVVGHGQLTPTITDLANQPPGLYLLFLQFQGKQTFSALKIIRQ